MPGHIDHFSIYRSEFKKNHEEELEKIYNEQGYEAVDAYVNTQCLKTYFNDALEKIKSTPIKQIDIRLTIETIDWKLYITETSQKL